MRLTYHAPVTLTFALAAVAITGADAVLGHALTAAFFSAPPMFSLDPITLLRMVAHVLGHQGWEHCLGNMMLLLLLGPMVEERYGSAPFLAMIVITALATGVLNAIFFSTGLLGASGIVFMCMALASGTNVRSGEIPLTLVIVALLYGGQEILHVLRHDQVSHFAHFLGGTCGVIFGLTFPPTRTAQPTP